MSAEPTSKRRLLTRTVGVVGALLVSGLLVVWEVRASDLTEKKRRAVAGCALLAKATERYVGHQSPGVHGAMWPESLNDLLDPPSAYGGPQLPNGLADLTDPWGQTYFYTSIPYPHNGRGVLILTTAPDGTMISQHGIGREALPPPRSER